MHLAAELVVDFGLDDPPSADTDFHASWRSSQNSLSEIVWSTADGGHWTAFRGKPIRQVFSDYEHFSSKVIIVPRARGDRIKVLPTTLDLPRHRF